MRPLLQEPDYLFLCRGRSSLARRLSTLYRGVTHLRDNEQNGSLGGPKICLDNAHRNNTMDTQLPRVSICLHPRGTQMKAKGFTLIELLIVVAIIAILAAIAVPNFLEAQTRAKVSRVQSDIRSMALAFEAYRTDYNGYPLNKTILVGLPAYDTPDRSAMIRWGSGSSMNYDGYWPVMVTTPTAYLTSLPKDPFPTRSWGGAPVQPVTQVNNSSVQRNYFTWIWPNGRGATPGLTPIRADIRWQIVSPGPDAQMQLGMEWRENGLAANATYDPTNGTISGGNISRFGP